jgi:hypothetical protein
MMILFPTMMFAAGTHAQVTGCAVKIEMAVDGYMHLNDPNGDGWVSKAELLGKTWEDSASAGDKDLQLWKVKLSSRPGEGLPTFFVYAITRGEGRSACTIVKIIDGIN